MLRPFISMSRSLPWRLLLVATLLYASIIDSRHEHADGLDARACYSCHFSAELGVLPSAGLPSGAPCDAAHHVLRDIAAPCAVRGRDYDARGPPLLG
jgi:hypothetical protein